MKLKLHFKLLPILGISNLDIPTLDSYFTVSFKKIIPRELSQKNLFYPLPTSEKEIMMTSQPEPTVSPRLEETKLGFNEYAERLNGRAAMIGFILMVVIEFVSDKGVLEWLGLR